MLFENKTILVTGGTGSWGHELVRQLLGFNPREIRIYSRNESSQFNMKQAFNNNPTLNFIIGDIKDKEATIDACQGVDYLFHLAALKHVPVCEDQPLEALKTNVDGTQNVIDAAIANNVERVIYVSTDKAADPSNFYGMTKALGERLIIHANTLPTKTKFVCIRGGNVLGTSGSVIHLFKKQIANNQKLGITDLNMTRFFLTVEEAIQLVFKATYESFGGEIFVMKMPACKITDLAEVLVEASGKEKVAFEEIGIRPGEKLDEYLLTDYEALSTVLFDEEYFVILPTTPIAGLTEKYDKFPKANLTSYHSGTDLISKATIKKMLEDGGFI